MNAQDLTLDFTASQTAESVLAVCLAIIVTAVTHTKRINRNLFAQGN